MIYTLYQAKYVAMLSTMYLRDSRPFSTQRLLCLMMCLLKACKEVWEQHATTSIGMRRHGMQQTCTTWHGRIPWTVYYQGNETARMSNDAEGLQRQLFIFVKIVTHYQYFILFMQKCRRLTLICHFLTSCQRMRFVLARSFLSFQLLLTARYSAFY